MGLPTEMIGVLSPTWPFCALWPFGTTHDYMDYPQENKGIQLNPFYGYLAMIWKMIIHHRFGGIPFSDLKNCGIPQTQLKI
jgi:hypothetical protein